jgi:lactate dehydrogenase-like 2-hydroxyacid dehydrogenase
MNICVFEVDPWERDILGKLTEEHEVEFFEETLDQEMGERISDAEIVSTFIYSRLNRDLLERLSRLQLVATRSAGASHIDMEYCQQRGIEVANVPGTEKTKDLLSDDEFAKMKDGVVLINTARGSVVNAQALARALSEGKVAAAGLDVLPKEPVIREEAELLRAVFHKEHDMETPAGRPHPATHAQRVHHAAQYIRHARSQADDLQYDG